MARQQLMITLVIRAQFFLTLHCLGEMTSMTYKAIENHALSGHTLEELRGISAAKCLALCLSYRGQCSSFNYQHVDGVCQINDADMEEFMTEFQANPNWIYFETASKEKSIGNCKIKGRIDTPTTGRTLEATTVTAKGCDSTNDGPMGMASGLIPDSKISASSINTGFQITSTRISNNGWCALTNNANQWLQVDFGGKVNVTGVQCGPYTGGNVYIDAYKVLYGDDGVAWKTVQNEAGTADEVFDGPPDPSTVVTSMFATAVYARFIRLKPTAWKTGICMRFELLGCRD